MPNPYVLLALGIGFLAAVWGIHHHGYKSGVTETDAKWTLVEMERKGAAQKKLDAATDRYIKAEAANQNQTATWEKKDNEREKYVDGMRIANGRLIAAAGGLFDRNGRPSGRRGGDQAGSPAGAVIDVIGGAAGCRLSDELQGFLSTRFADADRAAIKAQSGHDLAVEVKAFRERYAGGVAPQ